MFCRRKCCRSIGKDELSQEELLKKINQGALLVDVRSKQEYDEGHLQGAINIPEYEIPRKVEKIIPNKTQLIVLYCQTGGRSRSIYCYMKKRGYINVYNLYGGLDML